MRIQIDNTVRDMTPEEEAEYIAWSEHVLDPNADEALTRYANELTGAEDETLAEATETLIKIVKGDG